jgi:hypothetical protein
MHATILDTEPGNGPISNWMQTTDWTDDNKVGGLAICLLEACSICLGLLLPLNDFA